MQNIVVVEDNKVQRNNLAQTLQGPRRRVSAKRYAKSALNLALEQPIDLVILDLKGIGRLGGVEFCNQMFKIDPYTPIIVHTAFSQEYDQQFREENLPNIVAWISKGARTIEDVKDKASRALARRRIEQVLRAGSEEGFSEEDVLKILRIVASDLPISEEDIFVEELQSRLATMHQSLRRMLLSNLQGTLEDLMEFYGELQERQILFGKFKKSTYTELWEAFQDSPKEKRQLVLMLKGAIRRVKIPDISFQELRAFRQIIDLLGLENVDAVEVASTKHQLQRLGLDPVFRAEKEADLLLQLYQEEELGPRQGNE